MSPGNDIIAEICLEKDLVYIVLSKYNWDGEIENNHGKSEVRKISLKRSIAYCKILDQSDGHMMKK